VGGVWTGFCPSFQKARIHRFVPVYLYPAACPRNPPEVCRKHQDSKGTVGMSRGVRYKNPDLDTRPEMTSFENRHHGSNVSLSEGVVRSGLPGRDEVVGSPRGVKENQLGKPARARQSLPSQSLYKAEEKNTLISKRKKWEDRVDHSRPSGERRDESPASPETWNDPEHRRPGRSAAAACVEKGMHYRPRRCRPIEPVPGQNPAHLKRELFTLPVSY